MLSFITAPIHFLVSPVSLTDLSSYTCPVTGFEANTGRRTRKKQERSVSLHFDAAKETIFPLLGFLEGKKKNYGDFCKGCGGFVRSCKIDWVSEGDIALEAEILEFMKNSENPEMFPSKKQLIDAGRMDLVKAIMMQGGWLVSGWDFDDDENKEEGLLGDDDIDWDPTRDKECNNMAIQDKILESNEERSTEVSISGGKSSPLASSSGRSLEPPAEDDSGIEGILNRLEKERDKNFGFGLRERGSNNQVKSNDLEHGWLAKISKNATVAGLNRNNEPPSLNPNNGEISDSVGKVGRSGTLSDIDGFGNSLKTDMWRTWSSERAGFSDMEYADALQDDMLETNEATCSPLNKIEEKSSGEGINQIRNRLQHLELELSSVLQTLKSSTDESGSQKGFESSSDDLLKLSDAWEFQENEIMNAQDKLRSTRAKLAVLEGKMALAIIDAQKTAEEKQKRIDDARRSLQLLRTACIVWPNLASEVLLAGSFDGWATQRKMEKSRTGIFSLYLKLYPGRYEIKFIVDGEWKLDPLRPVVHNNGYENNLLIIT